MPRIESPSPGEVIPVQDAEPKPNEAKPAEEAESSSEQDSEAGKAVRQDARGQIEGGSRCQARWRTSRG